MAIKIITDSTCDIDLKWAKELEIEILPLQVTIDGKTYFDKVELSNQDFYEKLKNAKEIPTTTLISPQRFIECFEKYPDDDILGIFIASKLSGTFQSATIAKEELGRDNIYLVDSQSVACGLGIMVEYGKKLVDSGKSIDEIYETLVEASDRVQVCAIFNTLKYLVKGGRLTNTAGIVGTLLGVKPIISIKNGQLESMGKERGFQKAMETFKNILNQKVTVDEDLPMAYAHTDNLDELSKMKNNLGYIANVYDIGSVVGTHAGPGAVAFTFFNK